MLNGHVDSTATGSGDDYYDISTYFIVRDTSIDEIWNASFVLKHSNEFGRAMRHFEVDGELLYHTKHYTLTSLSSHSPPSFSLSPHSLSPHTLSISPLPSLSLSLPPSFSPLSLRCGYQYTGMQHILVTITFTLHHHYHQWSNQYY